jgi:enterochelin esterase family protein
MLACARGLIPYDGDPAKFLAEFDAKHSLEGDNHVVLNILAMSACYSPNVASPLGFDLPMHPRTGERIDAVWRRWLEFDPVFACERHAANLRKLELLHVECGVRDEYHLQLSARVLVDKLRGLRITVAHEEHPGSHRGISHRYGAILPKLIATLAR